MEPSPSLSGARRSRSANGLERVLLGVAGGLLAVTFCALFYGLLALPLARLFGGEPFGVEALLLLGLLMWALTLLLPAALSAGRIRF